MSNSHSESVAHHPILVAAGIIFSEDKVLVCQRKRTAPYPLQWEFPGGKLEQGETSAQCLHRELQEELSIHAVIGEILHEQTWHYPESGTFHIIFHRVLSFGGVLQNNVFEQFAWLPLHELSTLNLLEGNKPVAQILQQL